MNTHCNNNSLMLLLFAIICSLQMEHVLAEHIPIIDVHNHSEYSPESFLPSGPPYKSCYDPFNVVDPFPNTKAEEDVKIRDIYECLGKEMISPMTAQEMEQQMFALYEKYNVVAVVNSNLDLDKAERWAKRSPAITIPAIGVLKNMPAELTLEKTRKLIEAGKIKVIGEIAVQYDGLAPNDPFLDPYWALAVEFDIPAAIHIGPGVPAGDYVGGRHGVNLFRSDLTQPLLMEDVLRRHPGLRVYIMHAGWPKLEDMMLLLMMHPQVYIDVGMIASHVPRKEFHRYLRTLVEAGYGKNIMFGSDTPVWPQALEESILAIDTADFLNESQKRDIFYNNAKSFFRLDDADLKK